jgi:hypothetical protein
MSQHCTYILGLCHTFNCNSKPLTIYICNIPHSIFYCNYVCRITITIFMPHKPPSNKCISREKCIYYSNDGNLEKVCNVTVLYKGFKLHCLYSYCKFNKQLRVILSTDHLLIIIFNLPATSITPFASSTPEFGLTQYFFGAVVLILKHTFFSDGFVNFI